MHAPGRLCGDKEGGWQQVPDVGPGLLCGVTELLAECGLARDTGVPSAEEGTALTGWHWGHQREKCIPRLEKGGSWLNGETCRPALPQEAQQFVLRGHAAPLWGVDGTARIRDTLKGKLPFPSRSLLPPVPDHPQKPLISHPPSFSLLLEAGMPRLAPGFLIFDQGCSSTNYLAVMREEVQSGERVPELPRQRRKRKNKAQDANWINVEVTDSDKNSRKDDGETEVGVCPRTLSNLPLAGLGLGSLRTESLPLRGNCVGQ